MRVEGKSESTPVVRANQGSARHPVVWGSRGALGADAPYPPAVSVRGACCSGVAPGLLRDCSGVVPTTARILLSVVITSVMVSGLTLRSG